MTTAGQNIIAFTAAEALKTLNEACLRTGLRSEGVRLIRLGENAIFDLPAEKVIVRIARSADVLADATKEVAVAKWLRDSGLPAAEPTDHEQPIMVSDRPVTFWHFIDDGGEKASVEDLASILQKLHSLPVPPDLPLPKFDIFGRVTERIDKADELCDEDRKFLANRLSDLQNQYKNLHYPLKFCAVHGDAHQQNLIKSVDGEIFLIDFERFAFGPPESDLAVTATEHLIGWHSANDYSGFAESYGFDVMKWEGFPVLRSINELKMTTWLMQNINESDRVAHEFRVRLSSLHNDDTPRGWSPF
ncbi:aminoglycoside phosphotransferase family protein [Streptosporangium subroseum]|uniref:phosphotransferase family protein n=1 Tax=Streptosporangium subroseum TaxID=106412 RepID=UPI0034272FA6